MTARPLLALLAIVAVLGPSIATAALNFAKPQAGDPRCTVDAPAWETQRIRCRLPPQPQALRYHLKTRFQGSHDDTVLRLTAGLNETPLACTAGSKTESRFEDGEVTLECGFGVEAGAAADFEALLHVSHADFDGFTLTSH